MLDLPILVKVKSLGGYFNLGPCALGAVNFPCFTRYCCLTMDATYLKCYHYVDVNILVLLSLLNTGEIIMRYLALILVGIS